MMPTPLPYSIKEKLALCGRRTASRASARARSLSLTSLQTPLNPSTFFKSHAASARAPGAPCSRVDLSPVRPAALLRTAVFALFKSAPPVAGSNGRYLTSHSCATK
jgi:hypothetical protein